jgi:hypothetical protein
MVTKYAILDLNNIALNFIVWDGETEFDYGQTNGNSLVIVPENVSYAIGDLYKDGEFISLTPSEPVVTG